MTFQGRPLGFPKYPYSLYFMMMSSHDDPMRMCQKCGLKRGDALLIRIEELILFFCFWAIKTAEVCTLVGGTLSLLARSQDIIMSVCCSFEWNLEPRVQSGKSGERPSAEEEEVPRASPVVLHPGSHHQGEEARAFPSFIIFVLLLLLLLLLLPQRQ